MSQPGTTPLRDDEDDFVCDSPYNGMPSDAMELTWRKSNRSGANGNCVEVAKIPGGGVAMRNSRHTDGPALVFTEAEIEAFLGGAKDGEFDDLA